MNNGLFSRLFPIDCESPEFCIRCVICVFIFFYGETWFEEEEVGCVELPDPQYVSLFHCSLSPLRLFDLPKWQLRQAVLNWYSSCHLPCKQSPVRR